MQKWVYFNYVHYYFLGRLFKLSFYKTKEKKSVLKENQNENAKVQKLYNNRLKTLKKNVRRIKKLQFVY